MEFVTAYFATLIFILGLTIGSFLNVCIYRIPAGQSIIKPPSHCKTCNNQLSSLDLVPVFSWLFLRGKCRYCSAKVSPRYAVVELLTGILFLAFFLRFGIGMTELPSLIAGLTLTAILITISFIDFDHLIIPNGLVIIATVAGVMTILLNVFLGFKFFLAQEWWEHLLGVVPGVAAMLLMMVLGALIYRKEALGMGDVKLFIPIGLFLGWKLTIAALLIAIIAGGIVGIVLMITRKADKRGEMPFGPFIATGAIITMLASDKVFLVVNWYLSFFAR